MNTPIAALMAFSVSLLAYAYTLARSKVRLAAMLAGLATWAVVFAFIKLGLNSWLWNEQRTAEKRAGEIEAVLQGDSVFAALKQYDPTTYRATVSILRALHQKSPLNNAALLNSARDELNFKLMMEARLKAASDEAVMAYAAALVSAADELGERDPQLCVNYLYPPSGTARPDFSTLLSAGTHSADAAATVEVIKSASTPTYRSIQEEAYSAMGPVLDELANEYGADWQIINAPHAGNVDRGKLCRITAAFYRNALKRPPADAGKVLRYRLNRHA